MTDGRRHSLTVHDPDAQHRRLPERAARRAGGFALPTRHLRLRACQRGHRHDRPARGRKRGPPKSPHDLLGNPERAGVPTFASRIRDVLAVRASRATDSAEAAAPCGVRLTLERRSACGVGHRRLGAAPTVLTSHTHGTVGYSSRPHERHTLVPTSIHDGASLAGQSGARCHERQ